MGEAPSNNRTILIGPDSPELSIYSAMKAHVYARASKGAPWENSAGEAADSNLEVSVRKVKELLESKLATATKEDYYVDFYQLSTHFLRERLKNLNHGTVVQDLHLRFRRSSVYRWNEPITAVQIEAYRKLREIVGGRYQYAIDLFRIMRMFGLKPFASSDLLAVMRVQRQRTLSRENYKINTTVGPTSVEFTAFVQQRIRALEMHGLLRREKGAYTVSEKGQETFQWFSLFVYPLCGPGGSAQHDTPSVESSIA